MSVAFWSTELKKGGAPSEVQPPEGYVLNVQNAAIIGSDGKALNLFAKTQDIEGNEMDVLLTTLRGTAGSDQCQLSLVFGYDVPVKFYVKGDAKGASMHVSGYFQPGPEEDEPDSDEEGMDYGEFMDGMEGMQEGGDSDDMDSDDSGDDEEDDEEKAALYKAMAAGAESGSDSEDDDSEGSEPRVQELSEDEEESDSEDESLDAAFINKMIAKNTGGAKSGKDTADKAIARLKASEPPAKKSKGESGAQAKKGAAKGSNGNQGKKSGDKRKR